MSDIKHQLEKLLADSILELAVADENALRNIEVRLLGRKGEMNRILAALPSLPAAARVELGGAANRAKAELADAIARRCQELASEFSLELAESDWIDTTEPGKAAPAGHKHPSNAAIDEMSAIFERIGFRRARYAEAEFDHYAFSALNMPKDHPARDDWETFFLDALENKKWGRMVLTPHTSNAQGHEMERRRPPIRMVSFGKTYRRQSDVTHLVMFHQFEGLVIDRGINLTHLRGTLDHFAKCYFGADRQTRLRPHHFKFTEPSFEVDISCGLCNGTGKIDGTNCRVCKSGWLELGGAGMVHPNVLKMGGIDPKKYSGLAFGWGVERTMMMAAGLRIPDIRLIYNNDLRFLRQF
jgi:phenylalanyl-tRNA synthetase, alpha subunit